MQSGTQIAAQPVGVSSIASAGVIVPTLNAARDWPQFEPMLRAQGIAPSQVLIVDSSSNDNTAELARASGFRVETIARRDFNHGGTRQWAAQFFPEAEVLVYLTQDAILASDNAVRSLLSAFEDPQVGAAYGRQLPRRGAGPIEAHGRLFNYPEVSQLRTLDDRRQFGFKTIFISNSFAAYRRRALDEAGGFPTETIFGEDTITVAHMLLRGWKVAYRADACVYHSHDYTAVQEFKRYFDIGVLHSRDAWLKKEFGEAGGEGKKFVLSEMKYLLRHNPLLMPSAVLRTAAKFGGYRLGSKEATLKPALKKKLSMHHGFWK